MIMKEDQKVFLKKGDNMTWENILKKEEEDLPEDVKRARERVRQGLPSKEMPLIPQFDDDSKKSSTDLPDETKEALEKVAQQLKDAFESIDHNALLSILNPTGAKIAMSQKELIDRLVQDTINRIKSNRLYK